MKDNATRRNETVESTENEATVGKSADEVDAEQPSDAEFAAFMGVERTSQDAEEPEDDEPTKAELWAVIKSQQQTIEALEGRVEELEEEVEKTRETQKNFAKDLSNATTNSEEAKEIARSANANVNQLEAKVEGDDQQEKKHDLPGDVKPSSSPLDFFANCSTFNVKRRFVERQNKSNTYRAVEVAKKWQEYAHRRNDGSAVFWTKADVESALIEVLGEAPHRQTVSRVWSKLKELGSGDVREKTRQVGRTQDPKDILVMSMDTAEGLTEGRYRGLDLLDADGGETGGVTPVVTEPEAATV